MSPAVLVILLLALTLSMALGITGMLVYGAYNTPARRRLRAIKAGNHDAVAGAKDIQAERRRIVQSKLKDAEAKRQKRRGYKLREEIAQAGLDVSVGKFVTVSVILGLVAGAGYFVTGMPWIGVLPVAIAVGFGLPKMYLRIMVKRRLAIFTHLFADAIDIIVRGVKAGLPPGECIAIIGREMPDPVGLEFRLITEGTRLGMSFEEIMERAVQRVPTAEVRFFAIVLAIQRQTGGNLADTLGKLSDVLRGRKKMRDKVQAMSSEAKSSAMIIGSLPIIVGTLLGVVAPDYVGVLFTTDTGHILIAGGLGWMGMGILVMRQMIHFDM